jgi:phospholipid/cholesterol/gamma-HCH transport system substrate-binding protein
MVLIMVTAVIMLGLAFKNNVTLFLRRGDTIHADFAQNYDIIPGHTRVKMAGLQVGVVSGLSQDSDGVAHVSMKVDHGIVQKLGASPTASIEPLTILGGEYAVELTPGGGGSFTGTIPVSRSHTPVELDRILSALPTSARTALQNTVEVAGQTFNQRTASSLRALAHESTTVMKPSGTLITAVRGSQPSTDIPNIVTNVQRMAAALDRQNVALADSLDKLDVTTAALAAQGPALNQTIANLPSALDATYRGTGELRTTLAKLDRTATDLEPTALRIKPLFDVLQPTLQETLPVAQELPGLLRDARPLVSQLVPIASNVDAIVNDFKGPVINRIQNPILSMLGSTYRGTGAFIDTGRGVQANNKFYQEIGYMVTNLDRASQTHDAQGATLNFQAGFSAGSLAPLNLDDALAALIPMLKGQ